MLTLTAKITINDSTTLVIDNRNITSLTSPTAFKTDLNKPAYGVLSMVGSISFNDFDGAVANMAENLLLVEGLLTEIYLSNNLTRRTEKVGEWVTNTWNYDSENRSVTVSLRDELREWQEINVPKINYNPQNGVSKRLSEYYDYLHDITVNSGYNMARRNELDAETQQILGSCYVLYPVLNNGNLWACWRKLAEAAQSYVFKMQSGKITFKYDKGA